MGIVLSILLLSGVLSFFLGFPLRRYLVAQAVIDQPNSRSSHSIPTVRGGGLSIVSILMVSLLVVVAKQREGLPFVVLIAIALVATVSWFDDRVSLSQLKRFGSHMLGGMAIVGTLVFLEWSAGVRGKSMMYLIGGSPVLLLWIMGYANAYNFMDGINGIAGVQAVVTSLFTGLVVYEVSGQSLNGPVLVSLALGGASFGFLPHNFPKARMFMGDVGSVTIGFSLAAISVWSAAVYGWMLLIPLSLIHTNFVLDTAITLLRRVIKGENWWQGHREHFYQRLVRSGASHPLVTVIEAVMQILSGVLLYQLLFVGSWGSTAIASLVISLWIGFFYYCEVQFSRKAVDGQAKEHHV